MNYQKLKEKHQKEYNEFPVYFAFGDKQIRETVEKLGLSMNKEDENYYANHVLGIEYGGFILKSDKKPYLDMLKRQENELMQKINSDDDFVYDMFVYELNNHEYSYTGDLSDTLDALGYTADDINNDKRLLRIFTKAIKSCQNED